VQLLDCYLEAYQHVFDRDERRSLAQVITNVMYRRPRFDFTADYFVRCYQLECYCLRLHAELVKSILTAQVGNRWTVLPLCFCFECRVFSSLTLLFDVRNGL